MCLVDTGSSADCCLTLSSAAWLLIGPEASTSRRPSDQIQMWNERGRFRRRSVHVSHGAERWGDRHLLSMIKSGAGRGGTGDLFTAGVCFVSLCFLDCVCFFSFITLSALKPKDYKNVWHHHGDHNKHL